MNSDLNSRESLVIDFINSRNKALKDQADNDRMNSSPDFKLRKLGAEKKKATSVCIDNIIGTIYKNAIPFEEPKKDMSDDDASSEIRNFIANRTDGKDSEYYVREAIKRNRGKSTLLEKILTESEKIAKKFYAEKASDIVSIDIKNLTFDPTEYKDDINSSLENIDSERLSEIIANNVKNALDSEVERANREAEYNKSIEDKLANDMSVLDESAVDNALGKMRLINQPRVYQPSLMESVLMHTSKIKPNASKDEMINESAKEYTKLSTIKALRLESFNIAATKSLAKSYL